MTSAAHGVTIGHPLWLRCAIHGNDFIFKGEVSVWRLLQERCSKQPLASGRVRTWLRLLWENRRVETPFWPRAGYVSAMTLLGAPFRTAEYACFDARLRHTSIEHAPIFVIGHWRSGTTLLHNYLVQDRNFGFMSTLQGVMPETCIIKYSPQRAMVLGLLPSHRPMDNVPLALDLPQEEELPMALMSPYSYYHALFFPRAMRSYFDRYVLFRQADDQSAWRVQYFKLLQKATYLAGGRRLVLKNPPNTARIASLLAMFPNARFVHIYRNPYRVFYSTRHFYQKVLKLIAFQEIDGALLDDNIIYVYQSLLGQYINDARMIPPGQLTEVRYEDLERQPLVELERIYQDLSLPKFGETAGRFRQYAAAQVSFKKNSFQPQRDIDRRIAQDWAFTMNLWGYGDREAA